MFKFFKAFCAILVCLSTASGIPIKNEKTRLIDSSLKVESLIKLNLKQEHEYTTLYAIKDTNIFTSPTLTSSVVKIAPLGSVIYVYDEIKNSNGSYYITEEGYIKHSDLSYLKEYVFYPINKKFYTIDEAYATDAPLEKGTILKYFELNETVEVDGYNDFGYYRLIKPFKGFVKEKYLTASPTIYGSGLTTISPASGVYFYNGRKETYYSSRVLYHYKTPQWYVDNEGFYHDSNGYYVVAASDMSQGTVFNCSKGSCIVLDSGCAPGVTDYYVNW